MERLLISYETRAGVQHDVSISETGWTTAERERIARRVARRHRATLLWWAYQESHHLGSRNGHYWETVDGSDY